MTNLLTKRYMAEITLKIDLFIKSSWKFSNIKIHTTAVTLKFDLVNQNAKYYFMLAVVYSLTILLSYCILESYTSACNLINTDNDMRIFWQMCSNRFSDYCSAINLTPLCLRLGQKLNLASVERFYQSEYRNI